MVTGSDTYIAQKARFLKQFELYVKYSRSVLVKYFGAQNVNGLIADARGEFETILPQLPYIGGKQPFTQFIVATGLSLAVYRIAKTRGMTAEEVGELLYEIGRSIIKSYPAFLPKLFGGMNFSRYYLKRLRQRAIQSHKREYPDDYVYNFVEGDGKTFDYGVDYLECASCKFLMQQDASELAPYLCPIDILYSKALGWGLSRTMTLAEGAAKCDFRFKRNGPTNVAVPIALQPIVNKP